MHRLNIESGVIAPHTTFFERMPCPRWNKAIIHSAGELMKMPEGAGKNTKDRGFLWWGCLGFLAAASLGYAYGKS